MQRWLCARTRAPTAIGILGRLNHGEAELREIFRPIHTAAATLHLDRACFVQYTQLTQSLFFLCFVHFVPFGPSKPVVLQRPSVSRRVRGPFYWLVFSVHLVHRQHAPCSRSTSTLADLGCLGADPKLFGFSDCSLFLRHQGAFLIGSTPQHKAMRRVRHTRAAV